MSTSRAILFDITAQAWYFRNTLVRANYNNLQKGVHKLLADYYINIC